MSKNYISRQSQPDQEGIFTVEDDLSYATTLTFVELATLKEQVDALFSEEQSRLLAKDLAGDYLCDGCTI